MRWACKAAATKQERLDTQSGVVKLCAANLKDLAEPLTLLLKKTCLGVCHEHQTWIRHEAMTKVI